MSFARKDYEAWALLGEGGEAKVYRARQKSTHRVVAIREMKPDAAGRAAHEAELLATLRHQGLAVLIDYGFDQGRFHLVQDFVRGVLPLEFGPLPAISAIRCMRYLAKTLGFLHGKNIVHGDLNPGNLLLTNAEECVLVDFGMVRRLGESSFVAMGSPRYFTPEHFSGLEFTPATDVFACGALLYFLVTGKHLFPEADFDSVAQTITGLQNSDTRQAVAARWSQLPQELWPVFEGCLQYHAEDRFEDIEELDENLEIAEQQLRKRISSLELVQTGSAIQKANANRERQVLDSAYEIAVSKKDWRSAEALLDDLLAISPSDESLHGQLRFLVQRKKRRKRVFLFLAIALALFLFAFVLRFAVFSSQEEQTLQHFGQKILQLERQRQELDVPPTGKTTTTTRVVPFENAQEYSQAWVDSLPISLTDPLLRLPVGDHEFRGILQGESHMRRARIHVPPEGNVKWEWQPSHWTEDKKTK